METVFVKKIPQMETVCIKNLMRYLILFHDFDNSLSQKTLFDICQEVSLKNEQQLKKAMQY